MALWTFLTLVGNGRRVHADQVRAGDFRAALREWARSVDLDGLTDEARSRMAFREPPPDAETEFAWRWDSGVWMFVDDFEMDEFPADWGGERPVVWAIRTDAGPRSQAELF